MILRKIFDGFKFLQSTLTYKRTKNSNKLYIYKKRLLKLKMKQFTKVKNVTLVNNTFNVRRTQNIFLINLLYKL